MSKFKPTVPAAQFVNAMESHWISNGNISSPAFRELWKQQGDTFNAKIGTHGTKEGSTWVYLAPPTGTGKTEGLIVWCSLLPSVGSNIGVLIVCRQIMQTEYIANKINELAGKQIAYADHSEKRLTDDDKCNAQVLVITHAAYGIALEQASFDHNMPYDILTGWDKGERQLTVVDEALDVISHHSLKSEDVLKALSFIPDFLKDEFHEETDGLISVVTSMNALRRLEKDKAGKQIVSPTRMMNTLFEDAPQFIGGADFKQLKNSLRAYHNQHKWNLPANELKTICDTLDGVATMVNHWTYFHKAGNRTSLNTAQLNVPQNMRDGPVILDATAGANRVCDLFGVKAVIIPPTTKARCYQNVTFHVSRRYTDVGKYSMINKARMRTSNLMKDLEARLPLSSNVWVCAQKDVEKHLIGIQTPFKGFQTGHFGAIDGLNTWQDCDTCVVLGLPHKPDTWALNNLLAHGANKTDDFLQSDGCKEQKKSLKRSALVVDCTQIINRVQCRRVIDGKGNCAPTDVFLLIPSGDDGDDLLKELVRQMPDVRVLNWDVRLDNKTTKRPKINDYKERFVNFAKSIGIGGQVSATDFRTTSGISPSQWDRIVIELRSTQSDLTKRLREIGVRFYDNGKLKSANRKYLIRDMAIAA